VWRQRMALMTPYAAESTTPDGAARMNSTST
jgi:hypothetical protein